MLVIQFVLIVVKNLYFRYVAKVMLVKCILSLFHFRASNGEILNYMKAHNITGRFRLLESLYMNKLMSIVSDFPEKKQTAGTIRMMVSIV